MRGPDEKETIFKVPSTHKEDIQIYRQVTTIVAVSLRSFFFRTQQRWINALVEHREYANRSAFALESDETVEPLSRRKSSETLGTALKVKNSRGEGSVSARVPASFRLGNRSPVSGFFKVRLRSRYLGEQIARFV